MEISMRDAVPKRRYISARIWLVIAYLIFTFYAIGLFGGGIFSRDLRVGSVSLEELFILMGFITIYGILSTLPMLIVIGYQRSQLATLKTKIREDLWLCGLDSKQLSSKMAAFGDRNSWGAFIIPAVLTMIFLAVMWSFFLMPAGFSGWINSLAGGRQELSVPQMIKNIAETSGTSVIMITFLGAYFYILSVMIRRWLQSDLTTGVLWKINVRLAVALLVGFLLALVVQVDGDSLPLIMIGFLAGIVPDTVLRWLSQRAMQIISPKGEKRGVFTLSDLQEKIEGLNFWQVDRLFEEGIESIQDLAMKEIPDLLVNTRFGTPHTIYWVDQALLYNQVGDQKHLFDAAFIKTASDLLDLAEKNKSHDPEALLKAIQDGGQNLPVASAESEPFVMTLDLLDNIVEGLRNRPNLPYARMYWANTSTPERRSEKIAELER